MELGRSSIGVGGAWFYTHPKNFSKSLVCTRRNMERNRGLGWFG